MLPSTPQSAELSVVDYDRIFSENLPILAKMLEDKQQPLTQFIETSLLQDTQNQMVNNTCARRIRNGTLCLGAISGFPWAEPAYNLSKNALGVFFGIDTIIVFGLGACWVWNRVNNDFFQTMTPPEKRLTENFFCHSKLGLAVRQLPSLLNAITSGYTAYKFNTLKPLAVIVLADSYAFSLLGFKYFCQGARKIRGLVMKKSPLEQEIDCLQKLTERSFQHTLNMTQIQRQEFLGTLAEVKITQPPAKKYLYTMFSNVFHHQDNYHIQPETRSSLKNFCYILALSIAGTNFIVDMLLSQDGSENFITDISWLSTLLAIIGNLPGLALKILSSISTVSDIFNYFSSKKNGITSIAQCYAPMSTKYIVPISALLLALPTSAGPAYINIDIMNRFGDARYFFATIGGLQEVIYESFLLRKIAHLFVEYLAVKSNQPNLNQLIDFSYKLEKLNKIVSLLPPTQVNIDLGKASETKQLLSSTENSDTTVEDATPTPPPSSSHLMCGIL